MQDTPVEPWAATACPLCGQANQCAMEAARANGTEPGTCWCAGVPFTAELLAAVPPGLKNRACICERCARRAAGIGGGQ
ncbi:cysteine-rich CWC family protein [Caenimonas sedimenti]|uniref:Cysteine-rich CWC family protein n=1 Tax=Caenimonas sedimenti TaxID=2596921 RepID=A0A562ZIK8_9BURK|nr:cysteine-rich CWC family protein [Caenimonas sedimenti]